MLWVKLFGPLVVGVGLIVAGLSQIFGDCRSFEQGRGARNGVECAADGKGTMSANLVGGVTAGIGVIVFGIAAAIVVIEFRREPEPRRQRKVRARRR